MIWTFIAELEEEGHRLFADGKGRVAIADNSGPLPHKTDSGVLYLDIKKMQSEGITMGASRPSFSIPLLRPNGSPVRTATGLTGARVLAELYGISLYIADGSRAQ